MCKWPDSTSTFHFHHSIYLYAMVPTPKFPWILSVLTFPQKKINRNPNIHHNQIRAEDEHLQRKHKMKDFCTEHKALLSQESPETAWGGGLVISLSKRQILKGQSVEPSSGLDVLNPLHYRLNMTEFLRPPRHQTLNWQIIVWMCASRTRGSSPTEKQRVSTHLFVWLTWNQIIGRVA